MNPNQREANVVSPTTSRPSNSSSSHFLPVVTPTAGTKDGSPPSSFSSFTIFRAVSPDPLPQVIQLDVGGFKFTTSRTTLCSVAGSHLEAMFSGRHSMGGLQMETGSYFIDRDGRHFHHILNYLRSGSVITLPTNNQFKEELAIEADFFGLEGMVKAIRMPKMDLLECLPQETLQQWEAEAQLRKDFANGDAKNYCKIDPFRGLIPLFPVAGQQVECPRAMPLKFNPNSEVLQLGKGTLFMNNVRVAKATENGSGCPPVTVKSLDKFKTNFNKEWPNVLHRLQDILLEEPVIMAGGSVLRALTASAGIRTADWWGTENNLKGTSDIDLFLYGCDREEANRIARRIFYALSLDEERWVVIRGRGVINIHDWHDAWGARGTKLKIQIVLRIYDSPTEVLIGFDVDSCCCTYDGRNVWVCPRWISAIQSGVNVLNPLHAWPNKPSYELRLAKYAFRGFTVSVPGLDNNRVDRNMIVRSELGELKGLARFIKVASEMESAPSHCRRRYHWNREERRHHTTTTERPRLPGEIANLRSEDLNAVSEDLRLIEVLDLSYDDNNAALENIVLPSPFKERAEGDNLSWLWVDEGFPASRQTRDLGWAEIEDAGEEHPKNVDRRLLDAWDTSKRSREYLNGQMDKYDLDNLYYAKAYNEDQADK